MLAQNNQSGRVNGNVVGHQIHIEEAVVQEQQAVVHKSPNTTVATSTTGFATALTVRSEPHNVKPLEKKNKRNDERISDLEEVLSDGFRYLGLFLIKKS